MPGYDLPMIRADNLSRSFDGRFAVEGLSFTVPEGALCALLGPNGAGKTTTIRMLLGLIPATNGSAEVAGIALPASEDSGAALRARVGLLTEAPGFYDRISGRANLELFGRLYGLDETTLASRIEHWLRRLELWEPRERPFGTWSKGMKQRLALVRAVLHEPKVIFLDEPTAGLDPAGAREVRGIIADLRAEGRTILLCTHNLSEAEELADLIGVMRRRMLVFGPRESLIEGGTGLEIELTGDPDPLVHLLSVLPRVRSCRAAGRVLRLELDDLRRATPEVIGEVVRLGGAILSVRPISTTLEEIYLRAVGEVAA